MDIVEFQKRWIMRYINPIFFYLPFQSCKVQDTFFNIKVLLWNTYNPVKKIYTNRLTEKGRQINRPCEYYKILITYLGDIAKDDKDRREELVYCSSLNNGGQKESYDEGILRINQMADGTPLKPGRYKAHIFATYGIGAPIKEGKYKYQEFDFYPYKDNGKTYQVYVNWHLVELKTYTGDPTFTWEHNMGSHDLGKTPDSYLAGVNWVTVHHSPLVDPITEEYVIKNLYLKAKCRLSNCQTHQILKDTFNAEELAQVPLAEAPMSYNARFGFFCYTESGFGTSSYTVYTPKISIASSRCCFNMSQSYSWALFGQSIGVLPWQEAFGWKSSKGSLSVELEEVKGGFSLKDPITSKDYSQTVYDYGWGEDTSMALGYEYWKNFLPGPDPDGSFLDPNRLDGTDYKNIERTSGRLPSVYLSFKAERSQEEVWGSNGLGISLTSFHAYPEINQEYSGYRKTDFMGQKAVIPIGGDYQSFRDGILACKDGHPPKQTKYVEDNEIRFGPPTDYATSIKEFDLYNMNRFRLESKNGYYTKMELADALVDIDSFKPWFDEELELGECDENPKYQFTFEMTADEGAYELRRQKRDEDPENPILFYLYDEQAWKNCTGYALCDFLPAELPYPDLSIYQPIQKETVSEN